MTTREPLMRNYIPLLTDSPPALVNMSDTRAAAAVVDYWRILGDLVHLHFASVAEFYAKIATLTSGNAYVYDATRTSYLHVKLTPPYVGKQLYQRMELPFF